jgi:hypothetical protein
MPTKSKSKVTPDKKSKKASGTPKDISKKVAKRNASLTP